MVDNEEDDSFVQEFMKRAQKRQAKLAKIGELVAKDEEGDVSYPALSPLPEETTTTIRESPEFDSREGSPIEDNREENVSPSRQDLNYSSDLSLDCDPEQDVFRAEPVVCHSSPEHHAVPASYRRVSPRKQILASTALLSEDLPVPLQERQPDQKASSSQSLPASSSNERTIKDVQLKVERAEQTRTQLKKAVEVSKYGSKEHIEAARLLQIAELEHLVHTNFLAMYKQGIRKKTESLGSIAISGIRLKVSSKLRNDLADNGVCHYFFCIASCGTEVRATEIINTNDIRRQDLKAYLQFKEKVMFADLSPDFIAKVEIFELVIGQQLPKLLSRLTPSKKTKITPESYFRRVGSLKLTLADRDISYKNLVQWSEHEKSKYLERECKFLMELRPEQLPSKAGMLHVRCLDSEGRPDWSRFWVDLSEGQIRFWRCKQDASDGKKPNQVLLFNDICSASVQKLTPDDDLYRQNSFVIYSIQQVAGGDEDNLFQQVSREDPKLKIMKHQLAAENKEDRDSWCGILDKSLHCFREWQGKFKIYSLEELKEIFS